MHCDGYILLLLLLVIAPAGCQRFILKLGRKTGRVYGEEVWASQEDWCFTFGNFKIAFHQCVCSYFSLSCGAELGHALVWLEENRRSTCFPSMFMIYLQARTQPFFFFLDYLNEMGREAIACMQSPCKNHSFWLLLPSLAEGICSAKGYDPTKWRKWTFWCDGISTGCV